jgi:hypothetical protein
MQPRTSSMVWGYELLPKGAPDVAPLKAAKNTMLLAVSEQEMLVTIT